MMRIAKACLLFALLVPATAQAKWLEASSDHFVIYADDTPKSVQQFSDQLERFHQAMSFVLPSPRVKPSPSNRVTIYVVKDERAVRKLQRDGSRFTYAFYRARAGSSYAIVPRVSTSTGQLDMPMIALLHEYAHHFLLSSSSHAWPSWLSEGSAEFFASARFTKAGGVSIGMPAAHRAGELIYGTDVTAEELLDPDRYKGAKRKSYDAYYGKSWLLYHYLTFSPERKGQFTQYTQLLQQGKSSAEAGKTAFGDFRQLERELDNYLTKRFMTALAFAPDRLKPGPIAIRELRAGEAAIMPVRVQSRNGVTREEAVALLPEAQAVAARFPSDPVVLAALAEAEFDAGNDDTAIKAADAALAIDRTQVDGYVQKGFALFRKAEDADDRTVAYRAARAPFLELNALENDHPLPLVYFYMSFGREGRKPSDNAVHGLERAVELAPFDMGLRMTLVMQQIRDKRYAHAKANLAPIAYNPHGGGGSNMAQKLLDRLNNSADLDTLDPDKLMAELNAAQAKEGEDSGGEKPGAEE